MDGGDRSSSSTTASTSLFSSTVYPTKTKSRYRQPLDECNRGIVKRHPQPSRNHGDRFIPNRSLMNFDVAHYLLVNAKKQNENTKVISPGKETYRKHLAKAMMMDQSRILTFKSNPPAPKNEISWEEFSCSLSNDKMRSRTQRRNISKTPERTLDAPDIIDDYGLNLLDWSNTNILAIALGNSLYSWDASNKVVSELFNVSLENGPITSISWAPNENHIAVGMNSSIVEIWDATVNRKLRTLHCGHQSRVGSLSWNNHILSTGGSDALITNNDVRVRSCRSQMYRGHEQEVCGLKWSNSGQHLASGGNDNLLYIWDASMASSNYSTQWLHKFDDHLATVKALAWCPFERNLLASGGGSGDDCIKFWNTHTGTCLNSINSRSQVCSLVWSKHEKELLSSHGYMENQLTLWSYPSMDKIMDIAAHQSRVLYMTQSPDGCTVATASADETLKFWNIFGLNGVTKPIKKAATTRPFSNMMHIR